MPAAPDGTPGDVEALVLDRYLDTLLSSGGGGSEDPGHDLDTFDPILRAAADVLRRSLVRVHPSFQFEERLAARLSAMAAADGGEARLGALIQFRPLPDVPRDRSLGDGLDGHDGAMAPRESPAARRSAAVRPLLIGGALTSAALSLAGVAWVARRAVRTPALAELEGLL
jgi:hypothetical protein